MSETNTPPPPTPSQPPITTSSSAEDSAVKAVKKRYEGLVTIRTKANKGKGAWYWAHLEPILIRNPETNVPKAVKLKCTLCEAAFSASNPSRTASEHLKMGTCPNFGSVLSSISQLPPLASPSSRTSCGKIGGLMSLKGFCTEMGSGSGQSARTDVTNTGFYDKQLMLFGREEELKVLCGEMGSASTQNARTGVTNTGFYDTPLAFSGGREDLKGFCGEMGSGSAQNGRTEVTNTGFFDKQSVLSGGKEDLKGFRGGLGSPLARHARTVVADTGFYDKQLVLSGGKEDLKALAMLEESVKRLKTRKVSPGPALCKDQVNSAIDLLADWFYESCVSVSISSLEHPKFKAFLNQVGLPSVSRREFLGARLDDKFEEARLESEARIRDAPFFQLVSDGWKSRSCGYAGGSLIKFITNLPNGTNVLQKVMYMGGSAPSEYAEEVLWETTRGICGNAVQRCVGIVADKFKAKALKNLEIQNHWMINLHCQLQGIISLIKDFSRELPLFKTVTDNCLKIAFFFNSKSQICNSFRKFKSQEADFPGFIRAPSPKCDMSKNSGLVVMMLDDILSYGRLLHLVIMDDSYKALCIEDHDAGEVAQIIRDVGFWNDTEAVHSLVKLIKEMAEGVEAERPVVGQCLPLWEELRVKVKDLCVKYGISEGSVEKIVEKRFKKNYHPAWSAAFILDPLYLIKDASGRYLPPFKFLTHEQEKDVEKLITGLVSMEEGHAALTELKKWRLEGLDPLYAQAVQVKQRDPVTGKMKIANPQSSRLVWETCLKDFKSLSKIAVRLLFLQATSCGFKCNWSIMRYVCVQGHPRVGLDRAQKLILIAAHAKLAKRDFSNEEEKDAELLGMACGDDDMLNEVFANAPKL